MIAEDGGASAADDMDGLLEEAIAVLGRLISFPSASSVSNHDVADYICDYALRCGATVERLRSPDQDKENLWITFGEEGEGGLVLAGHIDVVPVVDQIWTRPPFALTREEQKIYGRGATDMKGFIACALASATLFGRATLKRPIHLAVTFDEEVGCFGAMELVAFLRERAIKPEAIFVGEPTSMAVVDRHKGFAGFVTEVTGKAAHSSLPHLGLNAIEIASALIARLGSIAQEQRFGAADEAFAYPYSSLNIGAIAGGSARNIVAANCAFDWEIRPILPRHLVEMQAAFEFQAKETQGIIQVSTGHEVSIVTRQVNATPPLMAEPDSAATAMALKFARRNETMAVGYGTEAGIYQAAGYPSVVCGPGDIEQAHKPDEWIEIEQLRLCLAFIRRLADHLREAA